MSVAPSHLRIGNWIHRKGSSAYGIVNGKLLALLEEDEKERERFEYIELSGELLEAAGWKIVDQGSGAYLWNETECWLHLYERRTEPFGYYTSLNGIVTDIKYLHHFQNIVFDLGGSELPLPESAKIIPQAVHK